MRKATVILVGCLLAIASGCESGGKLSLSEQMNILREENRELASQLEQSGRENKQLRGQIQVLSGLDAEVRLENLYDLERIKITRYTNFYDKDKDGGKEKLIVYIQPIDQQGDVVKATGAVDVQLWDLNRENGEALLGQWHVGAEELQEMWFATLITINYRLMFDVGEEVGGVNEPLTVKVTFTDYLTGKVFTEQKVIEPQG